MQNSNHENDTNYLKMFLLAALVGVLAGTSTAALLFILTKVTNFRDSHLGIIYFLPFAGLLVGLLYHQFGKSSEKGTGLILEEIHNPKNILPFALAPLVFFGTVVTHLFGGSAGREGTAVQVSSTLADQLSKYFTISKQERKNLLVAAAGAGFSAAIGAPFAGAIFGIELIQVGKLKILALFECLVASMVAFYVCKWFGLAHSVFPVINSISYTPFLFLIVVLSGSAFGLASRGFMSLTHRISEKFNNYIKYAPFRPFIAGIILVFLFWLEGSNRFTGLGFPTIEKSFVQVSSILEPVLKAGFTALTVGSGFKGGEFIPLVFIGSTLGSFLAGIFSISTPLFAALGFATVFGSAAKTPIACSIMAMEIFGWQIGPLAFLSCWIAFYFSGARSIYKRPA